MKVSKKLQKKKKADKRNIAIALCIIVILGAVGVIIFMPSNNTNKNTTVADTTTINTNRNTVTTSNSVNTVANSNFTSNSVVTTNANTINQNNVVNTNTTTTNTTVNTNTNTQTQTQQQSQQQTQVQQDNSSSSNGWNIFNWGSKEVDEDKAKEIAVSEFAKLGESVTKADLQAFPLKRTDGLDYFYVKSTKNTCEVRKSDGVVTRINANPVNQ